MKKILLRYLVFVVIPYFITKNIKKYFWKHANPELKKEFNNKLKETPQFNKLNEISNLRDLIK